MSRYSIHPLEENFQQWDIERKKKRNNYWRMLAMVRADYFNQTVEKHHPTTNGFFEYMLTQYGVKVDTDESGNITQNLNIVDESKYLLLVMKYGS